MASQEVTLYSDICKKTTSDAAFYGHVLLRIKYYSSFLQKTKILFPRFESVIKTFKPIFFFMTSPPIASFRTWSDVFIYPMESCFDMFSMDTSEFFYNNKSILNRCWLAKPLTILSSCSGVFGLRTCLCKTF